VYSRSLCSDVLCSDLVIGKRGSGHVGANAPGRSVTIVSGFIKQTFVSSKLH
jgi:hypothetical protein